MKRWLIIGLASLFIGSVKCADVQRDALDTIQSLNAVQEMLIDFYTQYIVENAKMPLDLNKIDSIKHAFCTDSLLNIVNENDPDVLDYDLFLDSQLCEKEWLNTLSVSVDTINAIYHVSYIYRYMDVETQKTISLKVIKLGEHYKINEILSSPLELQP